ncbi:hypothetical protein POM88_046996 [Heracleum sosnowskyi]|uniref:Uncharacterized protein n=1 Tax=Heracleum sosnowskyi TaxID=360622 RepID=A0AAD8M7M6_9APIA|nr:hypothetical protein POM88_046996 [Heracleum sosnowskyi]
MAERRNPVKEMEDSFARIRLEEEEEGGISYEGETDVLSEIDARWRNYTIGSKWLRQGGVLPAKDGGDEVTGNDGNSEIGVKGGKDPDNLGIGVVQHGRDGNESNQSLLGEIQGNNIINETLSHAPDMLHNSNVERENSIVDIETNGLQVTDPKRRRTNAPTTKKPKPNEIGEDDDMLDSLQHDADNQKNEFSAGPVLQARHAL